MPRELIDTGRDKRFVRRDTKGQFDDDVTDVGSTAKARPRTTKKAATGQRSR